MNDIKTTMYYIRWPGTPVDDADCEQNKLGVITYHKKTITEDSKIWFDHIFRPMAGFAVLGEVISQKRLDILQATEIYSSNGKVYTVEQFLNSIKGTKQGQ